MSAQESVQSGCAYNADPMDDGEPDCEHAGHRAMNAFTLRRLDAHGVCDPLQRSSTTGRFNVVHENETVTPSAAAGGCRLDPFIDVTSRNAAGGSASTRAGGRSAWAVTSCSTGGEALDHLEHAEVARPVTRSTTAGASPGGPPTRRLCVRRFSRLPQASALVSS